MKLRVISSLYFQCFNIVTDIICSHIDVVFYTEIKFDIGVPHNCCHPINTKDSNETFMLCNY